MDLRDRLTAETWRRPPRTMANVDDSGIIEHGRALQAESERDMILGWIAETQAYMANVRQDSIDGGGRETTTHTIFDVIYGASRRLMGEIPASPIDPDRLPG